MYIITLFFQPAVAFATVWSSLRDSWYLKTTEAIELVYW